MRVDPPENTEIVLRGKVYHWVTTVERLEHAYPVEGQLRKGGYTTWHRRIPKRSEFEIFARKK